MFAPRCSVFSEKWPSQLEPINSLEAPLQKKSLLYCSSIVPYPKVAGCLLIYRHLTRLKSYGLVVVKPTGHSLAALDHLIKEIPIAPPPLWRSVFTRGVFSPVGDQLIATHIRLQFDTIAIRLKPAAVLSFFVPDAYVTAAADFAKIHHLPLVLICHDDYKHLVSPTLQHRLCNIYCQAAARLCVSEAMAEEYERRYSAQATILYPIPSSSPKTPLQEPLGTPLRIGFFGSIYNGYEDAIVRLADAVAAVQGEMFILSPTPRNTLRRIWAHPAIRDEGYVHPDQVGQIFERAGVNVLAVVQSFDAREEQAFQLNFPSKLPEYATFGLPLLIVAPESASAVRWARSRGVGLISSSSSQELRAAVTCLKDPITRYQLASAFHQAAVEFFPDRLQSIFENVIASVT